MTSSDVLATKKQDKDQKNLSVRSNNQPGDESFQKLRNLFLKTEEMKEVSLSKRTEVDRQFKELHERLATSSGFLTVIKKSIDGIKIAYQRDILDLEKVSEQSREDIDRQIEEIRMNIDKLKAKETKPKARTYQEAFNNVVDTFQSLAHKYTN